MTHVVSRFATWAPLPKRPACYNRPPYRGYWAPNGYRRGKRVLRFIHHRMTDDCGARKSGDGQKSIPEAENWNCAGCRWLEAEDA